MTVDTRRSKRQRDWYEDDAFWKTLAPFFFSYFRTPETTSQELTLVLDLLGAQAPARILDLCCGEGRFAIELANRGFRVTGVDRTVSYLDVARARSKEHGVDVELIHQDARMFKRPSGFDFALNMLSSFGYFEDPADDGTVLRNLFESLVPGGLLIMDMMGKECLARDFTPRDWHRHPETGEYLIEHRSIHDGWRIIENRWIVIQPNGTKEFTTWLRLYSGQELVNLMRSVGFGTVDLYGGLDGAPYNESAQRLIAIGHK